jgi:hypothetical protein
MTWLWRFDDSMKTTLHHERAKMGHLFRVKPSRRLLLFSGANRVRIGRKRSLLEEKSIWSAAGEKEVEEKGTK